MATDQVIEAALQRRLIKPSLKTQFTTQPVGAGVTLQALEKPQALLRVGLRTLRVTHLGLQWRHLPGRTRLRRDPGAEITQTRPFEQAVGLQLQPQLGVETRQHLHHAHRVAATREEVVALPQLRAAQHLLPGLQHLRQHGAGLRRVARRLGALQAPLVPLGEGGQAAVLPAAAAGRALQLAAGGAWQGARLEQQDQLWRQLETFTHAIGDALADYLGADQLAHVATDLQRQADALHSLFVGDGECGDAPLAQQLDILLQRLLDVLRVVVLTIEDDQILQTPGDEQLPLAHHAQIAGAQPALAITLDEGLGSRFGVTPVALGDARPGDPDLADLIVPQHLHRLRLDDAQRVLGIAPATGWQTAVRLARCAAGERLHLRLALGGIDAHIERRFGQTVARRKRLGTEARRREALTEGPQGVQADWLGAGKRQAPAAQIERLQAALRDTLGAQAIGEIRPAGEGAAVLADGLQPARRPGEEEVRRHQCQGAAMQDRQQQPGHQPHVVIQRQPADPGLLPTGIETTAHAALVGQQVGVADHHPLGRTGGTRGVLQESQRIAGDQPWLVAGAVVGIDILDGDHLRLGREQRLKVGLATLDHLARRQHHHGLGI